MVNRMVWYELSSYKLDLVCIAWLFTNTAITYQSTGQRPNHGHDVSSLQHGNSVTEINFVWRSKIILKNNKDSETVLVFTLRTRDVKNGTKTGHQHQRS